MCQFIESIRVEHGKAHRLAFHQRRMDQSAQHCFGKNSGIDLEELVGTYLLNSDYNYLHEGLYKMRLVYAQQVEEVSFSVYKCPSIRSLQMIEGDNIDYGFKFLDRSSLEKLYSRKGKCDDILIVKNGFITDTSFANVAFFDGQDWHTPQNPLLEGTQRARLLQQNQLALAEITPHDLPQFRLVRVFNAMIRWEDELNIDIQHIYPLV